MAITRIWQGGAESGSIEEFSSYKSGASASAAQKYTGSYSFALNFGLLSASHWASQSIPSTRQVRVAGQWLPSGITTTNVGYLYGLRGSGASELVYIRYAGTSAANPFYLYVGGVLRDTQSNAFVGSTWIHIGIDAYINSSVGWVKVYANGQEILSYTGNTGNSDIIDFILGRSAQPASYSTEYFDDLYIDDTTGESSPNSPYIKKFYSLNVNGDGAYSQWTPIPTGSHYANVDDRPPDDDTSYLEAVTGSLLDSFTMTTFTLATNEDIVAMIPFAFAKRGSTTEQISLGTRSSGTNLIGTAQDLSTSYDYVWERQVTGSLGFDWNQSYMDSIEVIINSTGTY